MRDLSLGGCLVESVLPLNPGNNIQIKFSAFGERVTLDGSVAHVMSENRYGIRFEPKTNLHLMHLANIIEQFQQTPSLRRPTRVQIQCDAVLDRQPSILVNLSEGGCFIKTNARFNTGDIVEVKFQLGKEEIYLAAQIRWRTKAGIGVEYLSPLPDQISCISDFIAKQIPKLSSV